MDGLGSTGRGENLDPGVIDGRCLKVGDETSPWTASGSMARGSRNLPVRAWNKGRQESCDEARGGACRGGNGDRLDGRFPERGGRTIPDGPGRRERLIGNRELGWGNGLSLPGNTGDLRGCH